MTISAFSLIRKFIPYQGRHIERFIRMGQHSQRVTLPHDRILMTLTSTRDTLTVSAWNLLELNQDITRAQEHILAPALRRTDSSNPRTYYDLIEVEVLPMTLLDSIYSNRGDLNMNPVSPRLVLQSEGSTTAVLVLSWSCQ